MCAPSAPVLTATQSSPVHHHHTLPPETPKGDQDATDAVDARCVRFIPLLGSPPPLAAVLGLAAGTSSFVDPVPDATCDCYTVNVALSGTWEILLLVSWYGLQYTGVHRTANTMPIFHSIYCSSIAPPQLGTAPLQRGTAPAKFSGAKPYSLRLQADMSSSSDLSAYTPSPAVHSSASSFFPPSCPPVQPCLLPANR